ncbi:MAG: amino acid permease [Chloroflexi bacterium]|nr:amino acid permease [Chloroflexota bacterium]
MTQRKLKRKLGLLQLIMLGTAGTIAAEIFVLTGHAAGMVGPATVVALIVAGIFSYSIALNYCELATMYPVTGGGVTYVREAWGDNLLSFLVGSMDCISSTFYAALSAVGFAYSLKVFIPALPVVPVALVTIGVFIVLNILDVSNVGNVQIVLGSFLLLFLGVYIVAGLVMPNGFHWDTFVKGGIFIYPTWTENITKILSTVALVYCSYIGYEVIAHDAEEVENPSRNIPIAILVSLTVCALIYVLIALVTLGTVPWQQVAGSETALTDAVVHFLPTIGVPMMAIAGIIATLTSVNAALLSGTREAFTLGRSGLWPRFMSKLSRFRTPYIACLVIGAITAMVAAIGLVDLLSFVSSGGFLFVLFFANLAMWRLRKLRPNAERPFRAPLFPVTVWVTAIACLFVIASSDWRAIVFGSAVLVLFTIFYYTRGPIGKFFAARSKATTKTRDLILIAASHPKTVRILVQLASIIATASEDAYAMVLSVRKGVPGSLPTTPQLQAKISGTKEQNVLKHALSHALSQNLAAYTKVRTAPSVAQGILEEINRRSNVMIVLTGWPGVLKPNEISENPVKVLLQRAQTNVASLLDRGLGDIRRILVPVGGGPHSRLAIRLAYEIALTEDAQVTALRVLKHSHNAEELGEEIEDQTLWLADIIESELGALPKNFSLQVVEAGEVSQGILAEAKAHLYDLLVMGASEEWASSTRLFGSVDDWIADQVPCSALLCRRYEPSTISWIRRSIKDIEGGYRQPQGSSDTVPEAASQE